MPISGSSRVAALGDEDLALDDVDAGDDFGDGVFDLEAGVDLDEVEGAGLGVDEEFDGAGVLVADLTADAEGGFADGFSEFGVEVIGGGDFDDLLMPALDGAIAFVEVDEVAVLVAEELDLDMLGLADEAFEEDVGAAEGGLGFAAGLVEGGVEGCRGFRRRACRVRRRPWRP